MYIGEKGGKLGIFKGEFSEVELDQTWQHW